MSQMKNSLNLGPRRSRPSPRGSRAKSRAAALRNALDFNESFHLESASDRASWDSFITSHSEANFLQSWDFYEFHKARGKKVVRRIVMLDNKIVGAYAGVVETAKRGRYMAIAGGPILDWRDKKLVKLIFDDIHEEGKKAECVFVRIRPQLELSDQSLRLMAELKLKKAPMYLSGSSL